MNLENQVCSLELSKRLKELGIKQDSHFYWCTCDNKKFFVDCFDNYSVHIDHPLPEKICPAFTVAELGEMLPKSIQLTTKIEQEIEFSNFRLVAGRNLIFENDMPLEFWSVNYICDTTNQFRNWLFDALLAPPIYDVNEANSRAKMLIYLIENNLIKLEDVNA